MIIRVVVCGDEGVGKSSLVTSLVKDTFVSHVQPTLSPVTIPSEYSSTQDTPYTTVLVDTSSLIQDREELQKEIRRATVIWLVYSDHYTCERISLFWLPFFRSMGVNLPIVLSANKSDMLPENALPIADEMVPILKEFKEIESCIRCSAKLHYNVNQAFYLCQRAVTHPIAPLYGSKEGNLKPSTVRALERVFYLSDIDQNGYMSDQEFQDLQVKCFKRPLDPEHLQQIKTTLAEIDESTVVPDKGITIQGFILLNKLFAEKGRHETTWGILRKFHYTDSLSLEDRFVSPKFPVPENASVELSPIGYRFLIDLFLLFDKDNDGGLSESELDALFKPTPGLPQLWQETNFPLSTVRNEAGHVTLQGWLAQWSMSSYLDHKTTMMYLALLGFEDRQQRQEQTQGATSSSHHRVVDALKVTKPRKPRTLPKKRKVQLQQQDREHHPGGSRLGLRRASAPDGDPTVIDVGAGSDQASSSSLLTSLQQLFDVIQKPFIIKRPAQPVIVHRNVFHCLVLGACGSGKSSLLNAFLNRPFSEAYTPTIRPVTAVNSVEMHGGKQCYMILEELGQLESAVLENKTRLANCDVICYTYDSSDPDSFAHLIELRRTYPFIDALPAVYVALKADLDRQQQRAELQPDVYTESIGMAPPLHVSERWPSSLNELFVQLAEAAQMPSSATMFAEAEDEQSLFFPALFVGSAVAVTAVAARYIWRPVSK